MLCTDNCLVAGRDFSKDGLCDDGGPGSEYAACALGADCTDCGCPEPALDTYLIECEATVSLVGSPPSSPTGRRLQAASGSGDTITFEVLRRIEADTGSTESLGAIAHLQLRAIGLHLTQQLPAR